VTGAAPGFGAVLGGVVLAASFGLLYQRRAGGLINACALQAWAVAAAAAWQGAAWEAPELIVVGCLVLAVGGVALPMALRRRARQAGPGVVALPGIPASLLAATALVALAVLASATMASPPLARGEIATGLSVVLLGLFTLASRRGGLGEAIGLAATANGLILGMVGVRGMPLVALWTLAVLALSGVAMLRPGGQLR
jgi:hydrogenase-4 membrane subunit HyfE